MSPITVLLVEDDPDSRDIYRAIFTHAGYRVVEASDGRACLQAAERHRPDVIVMDMGLPEVDGWTAAVTLKANPATAHIPIIAVTVHIQESYRARAETVGCDSFMDKPCSPMRLIAEVTRIVERKR